MTTSLQDTDALYHVTAKVFQRSQGRSAVAAAAYRSASKLTDERTGQTFDYRQKPVVESFILAPANAPAWALDRETLWNCVEASEKRKDAQLCREIEVSIPRDIPECDWRAFAESVCEKYTAVGAIVDIAIHCPLDVNQEIQPHFHAMISTRLFDESTESGFASTKNKSLNSIFTSGSRHGGGAQGDALKLERERIAIVMNDFLDRAGSTRRVSHLSNSARGLEDREPEPQMGVERTAIIRKRKKHDRRSALVSSMRNARKIENEIKITEEHLMSTQPNWQGQKNGIKPKHQQDFKAKLLSDRFPELENTAAWSSRIHMVDVRNPSITKVNLRDGGWVEIAGQQIKVYGTRGDADALAAQIAQAIRADDIERLEEVQSFQKHNSGLRQGRARGERTPPPSDLEIETCADRWRSRGYTRISEGVDGVWVAIGSCRLQDLGDELRVHGKINDDGIRALVEKAVADWGSEVEIFGDQAFKDAVWLEAQRQGVTVFDQKTGELYAPTPSVKKAFESAKAANTATAETVGIIQRQKKISGVLRDAAAGEKSALTTLKNNDPDLLDFVTLHLDAEQRLDFAAQDPAEIALMLEEFREDGRTSRKISEDRRTARSNLQSIRALAALVDFDPDSPLPVGASTLEDDDEEIGDFGPFDTPESRHSRGPK